MSCFKFGRKKNAYNFQAAYEKNQSESYRRSYIEPSSGAKQNGHHIEDSTNHNTVKQTPVEEPPRASPIINTQEIKVEQKVVEPDRKSISSHSSSEKNEVDDRADLRNDYEAVDLPPREPEPVVERPPAPVDYFASSKPVEDDDDGFIDHSTVVINKHTILASVPDNTSEHSSQTGSQTLHTEEPDAHSVHSEHSHRSDAEEAQQHHSDVEEAEQHHSDTEEPQQHHSDTEEPQQHHSDVEEAQVEIEAEPHHESDHETGDVTHHEEEHAETKSESESAGGSDTNYDLENERNAARQDDAKESDEEDVTAELDAIADHHGNSDEETPPKPTNVTDESTKEFFDADKKHDEDPDFYH